MHPYYLKLNLTPDQIIQNNWREFIDPIDESKNSTLVYSKEKVYSMFQENFIKKLENIYEIGGMIVFNSTDSNFDNSIHIDVYKLNEKIIYNLFGINIAFDNSTDKNGGMHWFSLKNKDTENKNLKYSLGGTLYAPFSINELNLESSLYDFSQAVLVKTSVPHCIINGNSNRICLSIRLRSKNDTWEQVYNNFYNEFYSKKI